MGWFVCCVRTWIGTDNCQRRAMRKTKSVHSSGCGWGDGFSEKKKSRNISLPSIFSHRPSYIITATVTVLLSIDHRELTPPFELLGRYLAQYWIYDVFSHRQNDFYSLATPCIPCTLARSDFFLSLRYDTLPPGIFDTLALWSVQECKECMGVITEIYADTAALSAFSALSALSNSKMRIMQVMQMFFLFIAP